jgi:hypothetical protein
MCIFFEVMKMNPLIFVAVLIVIMVVAIYIGTRDKEMTMDFDKAMPKSKGKNVDMDVTGEKVVTISKMTTSKDAKRALNIKEKKN